MRISNKITITVEHNNTNICAKFQLHSPHDIFNIFFENLTFRLPWQPFKINDLDKIHMVCRELLQEQFCKTFVKIPAVTQK